MDDPVTVSTIQGQTLNMSLSWATNGVRNSLTNYRAHMQVRTRPGAAGDPILDIVNTGSNPGITLEPGGEVGLLQIRLTGDQTQLITRDSAFDVFIISLTDETERIRLVHGTLTLDPSVTVN